MNTYRVWFRDESAVLVDAESSTEARAIVQGWIKAGKCVGKIKGQGVELVDGVEPSHLTVTGAEP